jgi:hypothetical protein
VRVTLLLEENDLWDIVKDVVPSPTDLQQLISHKKKEVRTMRMIMDAIKDHLIPRISKKKMAKEMEEGFVEFSTGTGRFGGYDVLRDRGTKKPYAS